VEPAIAHRIARESHVGQRSRFGEPVIDHVERVASAVPSDARAVALLHDLFELCPTGRQGLRGAGLTRTELGALELLTHDQAEPYEVYVRRIAEAPGPAGRLARIVKLADLEDHLAHGSIPSDAPAYAWALEQLLTARDRAAQAAPGALVHARPSSARRRGVASKSPRS
jgi:hypothetical protein